MSDTPASQKILKILTDKVIMPGLKGANVNLVTFKNSGKPAELKYLLKNFSKLHEYNKHVHVLMDLEIYRENESKGIIESLTFVKSNFDKIFPEAVLTWIDAQLAKPNLGFGDLREFLKLLTYEQNFGVTLFLDNMYLCYGGYEISSNLSEMIYSLRKVNPMKISCLFISEMEFDDGAVKHLKRLSEIFLDNLVWGNEVLFDKDSCDKLFENQSLWKKHVFPAGMVDKVWGFLKGDPKVIKYCAQKCVVDSEYEKGILDAVGTVGLYEALGADFITKRYRGLVEFLSAGSLEALMAPDVKNRETDFLVNTGLAVDNGEVLNDAFKVYLTRDTAHIKELISVKNGAGSKVEETVIPRELMEILSPQETVVLGLLIRSKQMVSKDVIAQAIYGDGWESKYSDWALDKLISILRAKLKKNRYGKTIKVFKGRGVLLL